MFKSRFHFAGALGLVIAVLCGCDKPKPAPVGKPAVEKAVEALTSRQEPVARVHWLGRKRILTDTNAPQVKAIWGMPQTAKLHVQTLDKLSLAPWRSAGGSTPTAEAATAQLRAVLDDVVTEESYLEIRNAGNQPGEVAFAIHLDEARATVWQTNLAAVFESLTGVRPVAAARGWGLNGTNFFKRIELTREGEWTLLGLAPGTNRTLSLMVDQIQREHVPLVAPTAVSWLDVDVQLPRVSSALGLGWDVPAELPRIVASIFGEGASVRTRAVLNFAKPLELELQAWNFPTNLIHEPLISFSAARGVTTWLKSVPLWKELPLSEPPKQLFMWALNGAPLQTYLAVPDAEASNHVEQLSASFIERSRDYFATNGFGKLERTTNGGLRWLDFPFLPPGLDTVRLPGGDFLVAGWSPCLPTNRNFPKELLSQFMPRTNLIYYAWEVTEPRVDTWIYLSQTLRLVQRWAQLPPQGAAESWLRAIAPQLGNCATAAAATSPNQITITRTSSAGFTALELQLIADWLESPDFPRGLHSLNTPPDMTLYTPPPSLTNGHPAKPRTGTNNVVH